MCTTAGELAWINRERSLREMTHEKAAGGAGGEKGKKSEGTEY